MKKYIISTGIMLAAVTSVSAIETQVQVEGKPGVRPMVMYAKATLASTTAAQPVRGMVAATLTAAQAIPFIPTTGDAATDKAVKALHEEMEAKIKLIRDEYQAKIKVAIGDKKIINRDMRASTTMMRQEIRQDVRQEIKEWRDEKREVRASSSMATSSERRPMMGRMNGQVRGAEVSADAEVQAGGIVGFFSRMFTR